MIAIKVQCGCGQRFAFDVEPISGQMPAAVACPRCGVDGTAAANAILAERFQAPVETSTSGPARNAAASNGGISQTHIAAAASSVQRVAPAASVRVASVGATQSATPSSPAPVERKRLPGQLEPERAQNEARSKIMWGDAADEVAKFLMAQGFNADEAKAALAPILLERAQMVRKAGTSKIFSGIGMMLVPVIAFVVFISIGFFPIKIFGLTVAIGIWGGFRVVTGAIMFLSPKSEKGDVADM